MEELVNSITEIEKVLENDTLDILLSIITGVVPIFLTILSILLSKKMNRQNEQLQRDIANRDVKNQTREILLNIYNSYFNGFIQLKRADKNIPYIFISEQSFYTWALEAEKNYIEINSAYNRAKLLIDDIPMVNYLKETTILFSDFYLSIANYIKTGQATNIIENAWNHFTLFYSNVKRRDYMPLYLDQFLGNEFVKFCLNNYTVLIQEKLEKYISKVASNEFDNYFKKYITL